MKKQKKSQILTMVTLGVFSILLVLGVVGLSGTVANIDGEVISHEPEAILASAGVTNESEISLPVAYFDQKQDKCVNIYDLGAKVEERQFEWASCGYPNKQIEQGLVEYELNEDYSPVGVAGKLLPNRGMGDLTRWFENVEGKSKEYTGRLQLKYTAGEVVEFGYESEEFYPLDAVKFSEGDEVNKDRHNHLWTMSFAVPVTVMASGDESLEITADDDTFVFVGNQLVLDMGGVHEVATARLAINEAGEVYSEVDGEGMAYSGVTVEAGEGAIIRVFHADRDASESVLGVKIAGMNLNVMPTQLANGDDGVQVAYDPSDPGYIGPLGESEVVRPDSTKGLLIIATILGCMIVIAAVFVVISVKILMRNRRNEKIEIEDK